jgi:arginine N-succinyltransferase
MRRSDFRDELLAELLPPLLPDGTSYLWEAIGRRFTGLTYREADRLSKLNKEFIKGLFPDEVYATLLSDEAQRVIGEVGEQTRGVEKLLRRIGFRYAERVDPFDGGPHFLAATDEVSLVRQSALRPLDIVSTPLPGNALAARLQPEPPYFVATLADARSPGAVRISTEAAQRLGVATGDPLWTLPIG